MAWRSSATPTGSTGGPMAFADVADPLVPTPPRSLVEKAFAVVRWTAPHVGGHFAPSAAPQAWTDDLLGFTDALRAGRYRTSA